MLCAVYMRPVPFLYVAGCLKRKTLFGDLSPGERNIWRRRVSSFDLQDPFQKCNVLHCGQWLSSEPQEKRLECLLFHIIIKEKRAKRFSLKL